MRCFNTEVICVPSENYMVDVSSKAEQIIELIDQQKYFTINRPRQYGKTNMLLKLRQMLQDKYYVISINFQDADFKELESSEAFIAFFNLQVKKYMKRAGCPDSLIELWSDPSPWAEQMNFLSFSCLRERIPSLCAASDRGIVLMIDEVDRALNFDVLINFLGILRGNYTAMKSKTEKSFQSVILVGVTDIKNLKTKIRSEEGHTQNSPWNIAADLNVDMSFSAEEISGMLLDYEEDHHSGMNVMEMATLIRDYTSGYPFLVSRICKCIDETIMGSPGFKTPSEAWTKEGFLAAVKIILEENNSLFSDMFKKIADHPDLDRLFTSMLFEGKTYTFNPDNIIYQLGRMYGFLKRQGTSICIANRIFNIRLYNYYLDKESLSADLRGSAQGLKSQFTNHGRLNMDMVLTKFQEHFNSVYGNNVDSFIEKNGRRIFLLFLRTIINGTGHYYVEAAMDDDTRTDVIIDYHSEQFIVELKIWRGQARNASGERQLIGYLDKYHLSKGWMLIFNFNKTKKFDVREVSIDGKTIMEVIV